MGEVLDFTRYMFEKTLGNIRQSKKLPEYVEKYVNDNLAGQSVYHAAMAAPLSLFEEYQLLKERFTLLTKENLDFIENSKKLIRKRFGGNTKFLKRELKAEILLSIFFLSEHSNNDNFIKDFIYLTFKLKLDVLAEDYQKGYEEINQFVKQALEDKDKIQDILNNINVIIEEDMPSKFIFGAKELEDIYFTEKYGLTNYDREIYNAIVSLYHEGHEYITPQTIYNVLSGDKRDKSTKIITKIDADKREEILSRIKRMNNVMIEIPMKMLPFSFMKFGLKPLDVSYKMNLLPCVILKSAKLNGKMVDDCICIIDEPPMSYPTWSYNRCFRDNKRDTLSSVLEDKRLEALQNRLENLSTTSTVDIKMLNTPLSNTSENIVLKCYLLRSIAIAKKKNNKMIKIAFNDVYSYIGITKSSDENSKGALRGKRYDIREKVIKCLDFWKKRELIKTYSNTTNFIKISL